MNLIERLESEHRSAAQALESLDAACEQAARGERRADLLGRLEAGLGVVGSIVHGHADAEEEQVFPAMRDQGVDALLGTLTDEHRQVRALYAQANALLAAWSSHATNDAPPWVAVVRELRGRLAMPMQRENLMLFPRARRLPAPARTAWKIGPDPSPPQAAPHTRDAAGDHKEAVSREH